MNLILASDFTAIVRDAVSARIRSAGEQPRIAWIAPYTAADTSAFRAASQHFGALGFSQVECVDIDEERDDVQIAYLHQFDVIYLSDGDAVRFRYNAIRAGLAGRLRQCANAGRLIVGAGGGALLLTPNVSLSRLSNAAIDEVLASRGRFEALSAVPYEVLPGGEAPDATLLDQLQQYSARVEHDILIMASGAALFPGAGAAFEHVGAITRYRHGKIIERLT
jgi:peptidase E